ncbi:Small nuclear ribonucleoprotein-associated protein B [Linum perenne]
MEAGQEMNKSCGEGGSSEECNSETGISDTVNRVKKLLFRQMLVGIKDGRFFMGTFHCMDKQGNIILQDAVEYRSTRRNSPSPMEQRCLGLILIPFSARTSCHIECPIEEQMSLMTVHE